MPIPVGLQSKIEQKMRAKESASQTPPPQGKEKEAKPVDEELKKLQERLQRAEDLVKQQGMLLESKEVKAVLEDLASGKKRTVKKEEPDEKPKKLRDLIPGADEDEEIDFDSLTNKQLVRVMADAVETFSKQSQGDLDVMMEERLEKLNERFESLQGGVQTIVAKLALQEMISKYPDFMKYKNEIGKVMQENPALGVDAAYRIVRADKVLEQRDMGFMDTEKPESSLSGVDHTWVPPQMREPSSSEGNDEPKPSRGVRPGNKGRDFVNLVEQAAVRTLQKKGRSAEVSL